MKKIASIIFIGCLSVLFAEVLSGSSQVWYLTFWGIVLTLPLYLAHVVFFLTIAVRMGKTTLPQLYIYGILFGLYESWITKVIWAGYFDRSDPSLGTIFGVGVIEFPSLVFFWHPLMSFILPIIVYQILTGRIIASHQKLLQKSRKKSVIIALLIFALSIFSASGNHYSLTSVNWAVFGTYFLIAIFYTLSKKLSLETVALGKTGFRVVSIYLVLLYIASFVLMLPNRIPTTAFPYITVGLFYALALFLIIKTKKTDTQLVIPDKNMYSIKDLSMYIIALAVLTNLACLLPIKIAQPLLVLSYGLMYLTGIIVFITIISMTILKIKAEKLKGYEYKQ